MAGLLAKWHDEHGRLARILNLLEKQLAAATRRR